jgi:uncharacterized protein YkwD
MKKKIFSLILFVMLTFLLALPASAVQTSTEQQTALEIAALINQYRAENGLYQYVYNSTLASVAQTHTDYQVSINLSTHEGAGGSTSKERVTASGYGGGAYIFVNEMIYAGMSATPQAALDWWKNSPIHNAIMLSTEYHEIGVGVRITAERKYYTVNVASIQGVTSPGVGSAPVEPKQVVPAPVTVAAPKADGSIVHLVEQGQTLQAIADAYQVALVTLLANNQLAENSALSPGQAIIVKLPEPAPAVANQPAPDQPAEIAPSPGEVAASQPEMPAAAPQVQPAVPEGYTLIPNLLLTVLVLVALLASAGVTVIAYLRLSDSGQRRRK